MGFCFRLPFGYFGFILELNHLQIIIAQLVINEVLVGLKFFDKKVSLVIFGIHNLGG